MNNLPNETSGQRKARIARELQELEGRDLPESLPAIPEPTCGQGAENGVIPTDHYAWPRAKSTAPEPALGNGHRHPTSSGTTGGYDR